MNKTEGNIATSAHVILPLTDDLFIGKGHDKLVFLHPFDETLCVKIYYNLESKGWARELRYRKALKKSGRVLSVLPEFFGYAATSAGGGVLFERVRDADGKTSASLADIMSGRAEADYPLGTIFTAIREIFFEELPILCDDSPENFLVQKVAPDKFRVRVVDGIGAHAYLPVTYVSDIAARAYVALFWHRFVSRVAQDYGVTTDEIA